MELFANDLSIHQQFHDTSSFREALHGLMAMRNTARHFGREVHSHRALLISEPLPGEAMPQALGRLRESERRAAMRWLTSGGPFWDDNRRHSRDEWLECQECQEKLVTDSAVGEAAYRNMHSIESGLVSVAPSNWNFSPVKVIWRREDAGLEDRNTALENWWDTVALEDRLQNAPLPVKSWNDLQSVSINRYQRLTFADDCFEPLSGVPFAKSSMERILQLLNILDRYASAFDAAGNRTLEGHRIKQDFFTGKNALFSNSSDREKIDFRNELTFEHPNDPEKSLFCPWHGKERHKVLRLHFSWPIRFGEPVYVVYVGRKITRQ